MKLRRIHFAHEKYRISNLHIIAHNFICFVRIATQLHFFNLLLNCVFSTPFFLSPSDRMEECKTRI